MTETRLEMLILKCEPTLLNNGDIQNQMNKTTMIRQGDLLIERIDRLPKNIKKLDGAILALGEATGHAHSIEEPATVQLYESENDSQLGTIKFMRLTKASGLIHQEHARIPLARGTYRVIRQREYSPQAIRRVAD